MINTIPNSSFGDRYVTRDGKIAVYCRPAPYPSKEHIFYTHETEGSWGEVTYFPNGHYYKDKECARDIVRKLYNPLP